MDTINLMNKDEVRNELKNCLLEFMTELRELPPVPEPPDRCGIDGAEEVTGLKRKTIYQLTKPSSGSDFPSMKFGGKLVFSRKALRAWMESKTSPKVSNEAIVADHLQREARKMGR